MCAGPRALRQPGAGQGELPAPLPRRLRGHGRRAGEPGQHRRVEPAREEQAHGPAGAVAHPARAQDAAHRGGDRPDLQGDHRRRELGRPDGRVLQPVRPRGHGAGLRRRVLPPPLQGQPGLQALHGPRERVRRVRPRPRRAARHDRARADRRAAPAAGGRGRVRGAGARHGRRRAGRMAGRDRRRRPAHGQALPRGRAGAARPAGRGRHAGGRSRGPRGGQGPHGVAHRGHAARVPALRSAEPVVRLPGAPPRLDGRAFRR